MQQETKKLIEELFTITVHAGETARKFKDLSSGQLNFKKGPSEWSILECIEHLNLYGDFYLPEIERAIITNCGEAKATIFKSGLIGNYFANLMKGKNGQVKKMKSPKDKNPVNSSLTITTIDRFLKQVELLKSLLIRAEGTDLTRTKTAISLTELVRLRLGDTLRFFVYHIERHMLQAERVTPYQVNQVG